MKEYSIQYGNNNTETLSIIIDKDYLKIKDANGSLFSEMVSTQETDNLINQLNNIFTKNCFPTAKEFFTDWNKIPKNDWSKDYIVLQYKNINNKENTIEVGLYHENEPTWDNYYQLHQKELPEKDLTLHVLINDDVIFCHSIW